MTTRLGLGWTVEEGRLGCYYSNPSLCVDAGRKTGQKGTEPLCVKKTRQTEEKKGKEKTIT